MLSSIGFVVSLLLQIEPLQPRQVSTPVLSSVDQIQEDFANVPCKNKERLNAVRKLFEKMGAPPEQVSIAKVDNAQNLFVTLKGSEPGRIVIGAHYDLVEAGCGAIDNWSGIVAMAHTYASVRKLDVKKTAVFVAFGNEESGRWGSRGMVARIPKSELPEYCAMINIDSFGMAAPFAFREVSSNKLTSLVEERAAVLKVPFIAASIPGADADSSSFLERRIPAVTLSGLTEQWPQFLHTKKDQIKEVNFTSVYLGYRLALATWAVVNDSPCNAYSEATPSNKGTK